MDIKPKPATRLSPEYVMGGFTAVDNIFICEYMKNASENDTKTYLYGLYIAHSGAPSDIKSFASALDLTEEEVLKSFYYWQEFGLLDVANESPLDVVYHPISNSPIRPRKIKVGKYDDFNKKIQSILSSRMITPTEYAEYYNIMELFHMEWSALVLIASYCAKLKGSDVGVRYISTVARNFAYRKVTTLSEVERELKEYELQTSDVADVIKKLGLKKKVDTEDSSTYKKWLELGFNKESILKACEFAKGVGASMRKLDAILSELYGYKKLSVKEIDNFYAQKHEYKTLAIDINKALSIYNASLDNEINTYIIKWLDLGFDRETLLKIANYCFTFNFKSLADMDYRVNKFYKLGIVTSKSFDNYFVEQSRLDEEIAELLDTLGIDRRVNASDKRFYQKYLDIGYTKEFILCASELARNASSPLPYILSILANWKRSNIQTLDQARLAVSSSQSSSGKAYTKTNANEEMQNHNYTKEEWNSLFTSIEDWEIK